MNLKNLLGKTRGALGDAKKCVEETRDKARVESERRAEEKHLQQVNETQRMEEELKHLEAEEKMLSLKKRLRDKRHKVAEMGGGDAVDKVSKFLGDRKKEYDAHQRRKS